MNILETMKEFLPQIIATAVALVLLPLLKLISKNLIKRYGRLSEMSQPRIRQTRHVVAIIWNCLFFLLIAMIWGVKPQNLLIGLTSAFAFIGVALFAQWSMLSNITAGIVMFFSAPYHVGSRIKIIDKEMPIEATIEMIGTFYTHIRTEEDELIVIPNNLFLQKMVGIKKKKRSAPKTK